MLRTVFNETSRSWEPIDRQTIVRGIVYWDDNYIEYGYFDRLKEDWRVVEDGEGSFSNILLRNCKHPIYFNRSKGCYSLTELDNNIVFAHGSFPYSFERHYSTRYLEEMFQAKNQVKENVIYNYIDELPYTFGLEFETAAGYIPEEELYRVGLIPLRDGSITGLEYSTIVLGGDKGLNILREQIDVLKEYTIFDKECSLHIHYGSFNLTPEVLLRLNNLFATSDIASYAVPWAFTTSNYKKNGKDYCKMNSSFMSFNNMYKKLVGRAYFGDLYQPHPSDPSGDRKWDILSRYKALNLINAMCYDHNKTAEFRFLRPTYNFDKILVWLFVLGAYIKYAEDLKNKAIKNISLNRIISTVYSTKLSNMLIRALSLQKEVVQTQSLVQDFYGMRVDIEDQILTYKNLSKNQTFFY
jgi:hypothetical protein